MKSKDAKKRQRQVNECRDESVESSCYEMVSYCDCCGCYDYTYCC